MTKFVYSNAKNTITGYMLFQFNCGYHLRIFFENETNTRLKFRLANKLTKGMRYLILIYQQNLLHGQKLQKRAYDKSVKLCSYVPDEKIWLESKYIKMKQN